jgi:N-acetylglucosamine-6-phosphate deacetylase
MLLHRARVVTADRILDPGWLEVRGARIAAVGEGDAPLDAPGAAERVDLDGRFVLPGFVDIHVHGGGGASYTVGAEESVRRALEFHRGAGTTRAIASLVTAPVDDLVAALGGLAHCREAGLISGVHLEGPFLARSHCGAQDPRSLRAPDPDILDRLLQAGRGAVRMITLAPELPGAIDLIGRIVDAGVVAAIGHSNATYDVASAAIDAGASVATHLFNGMRALHQREPGIVGAALERTEVCCELIADGHHLHPAVLRQVFALAPGRVCLVTDAISAAGAGDGRYPLGPLVVEVSDGHAYLEGTRTIAGSTTTMAAALRHATAEAGIPLLAAAQAAASTPAALFGLDLEAGVLAAGRCADLVVLERDYRLVRVMSAGEWVRAPEPDAEASLLGR